MENNSLVNQSSIPITLSFSSEDDAEYRDRQARQLLSFCQKWRSVEYAQLASKSNLGQGRTVDFSITGQLLLSVAPTLIKDFTKQCMTWLQMANAKPVKIKLGAKEAEFAANTDKEQLERWILALQG